VDLFGVVRVGGQLQRQGEYLDNSFHVQAFAVSQN
jgi:hypothetical protein